MYFQRFLTLVIWNNCFSTRFSGFLSLGFWFWFKRVFSFIHYCYMLFLFSIISQCWTSAGWQLNSFVAISASRFSVIFVFRQPSLKCRITQKISGSLDHFFSQRSYLYSSIIKKKSIQDYRQHNYFHSQHFKMRFFTNQNHTLVKDETSKS